MQRQARRERATSEPSAERCTCTCSTLGCPSSQALPVPRPLPLTWPSPPFQTSSCSESTAASPLPAAAGTQLTRLWEMKTRGQRRAGGWLDLQQRRRQRRRTQRRTPAAAAKCSFSHTPQKMVPPSRLHATNQLTMARLLLLALLLRRLPRAANQRAAPRASAAAGHWRPAPPPLAAERAAAASQGRDAQNVSTEAWQGCKSAVGLLPQAPPPPPLSALNSHAHHRQRRTHRVGCRLEGRAACRGQEKQRALKDWWCGGERHQHRQTPPSPRDRSPLRRVMLLCMAAGLERGTGAQGGLLKELVGSWGRG